MLGHVLNESLIFKLLDFDLLTTHPLRVLIELQTVLQCFIKVPYLMILPIGILDWSTIESSNKLNTGDGAFPSTWAAQLFFEDRIVEDSKIPKLGILVKCVKALPIVDEVVLHREHVEIVEARLVVDITNTVVVQCQSFQILKMAEFYDFIPRLDVVALQVNKLEEAELFSRYRIHTANLVTVIAHKM